MAQQALLFEIDDYIAKPKTGKNSGKKRGKYKPRSKIKPFDVYRELSKLYKSLGDYFNMKPLDTTSSVEIYKNIRIWNIAYKEEAYIYQGEIVRGENFKITEAEIIGTELLSPEERYFLHKELFERLNADENTDDVLSSIEILTEFLINFKNFPLFLFLLGLGCKIGGKND